MIVFVYLVTDVDEKNTYLAMWYVQKIYVSMPYV